MYYQGASWYYKLVCMYTSTGREGVYAFQRGISGSYTASVYIDSGQG